MFHQNPAIVEVLQQTWLGSGSGTFPTKEEEVYTPELG